MVTEIHSQKNGRSRYFDLEQMTDVQLFAAKINTLQLQFPWYFFNLRPVPWSLEALVWRCPEIINFKLCNSQNILPRFSNFIGFQFYSTTLCFTSSSPFLLLFVSKHWTFLHRFPSHLSLSSPWTDFVGSNLNPTSQIVGAVGGRSGRRTCAWK